MSNEPKAPFAQATGYAAYWEPVPAGMPIPADAQIVNGVWRFPVFGCDSLDHTVDAHDYEIERLRAALADLCETCEWGKNMPDEIAAAAKVAREVLNAKRHNNQDKRHAHGKETNV